MLKVVGASWTTQRVCWMIVGAVVILVFVCILTFELDRTWEDGNYSATVFWSERIGYRIQFYGEGNNLLEVPKGVARAVFRPDILNTGWAELEIQSQGDYPDEVQAYAAGFLEGSLSWQLIHHHWLNTVQEACQEREYFCEQVRYFLRNNTDLIRETALQQRHEDQYWHQIFLFYKQLDGIKSGWQYGMFKCLGETKIVEIPDEDFLWMNIASDLVDMEIMFNGSYEETHSSLAFSAAAGISSAFVKLLPASQDLFIAHNSGGLYCSMLKMLKRYQLNYHLTSAPESLLVPGKAIVFSSYPGAIHSQDDFYQVSGREDEHRLAITGSAIRTLNLSHGRHANAIDQVLMGPRVMAANRLAISGTSWGHLLGRGYSGTGNKQWLVIDPSRLSHKGKKGLLLVIEQRPGHIKTQVADHSHVLWKRGYLLANHGLHQINSSDQGNVTSFADVPLLTDGGPLKAVAKRGDLPGNENNITEPELRPLGTTDFKILSLTSESRQFQLQAVAGPTHTKPSLPPFQWSSSSFNTQTHVGQPDLWNFRPIQPSWAWN